MIATALFGLATIAIWLLPLTGAIWLTTMIRSLVESPADASGAIPLSRPGGRSGVAAAVENSARSSAGPSRI